VTRAVLRREVTSYTTRRDVGSTAEAILRGHFPKGVGITAYLAAVAAPMPSPMPAGAFTAA